jgi:hypothetical protein
MYCRPCTTNLGTRHLKSLIELNLILALKFKLMNFATFGHKFVSFLLIWFILERKFPYDIIRMLNNSKMTFTFIWPFYEIFLNCQHFSISLQIWFILGQGKCGTLNNSDLTLTNLLRFLQIAFTLYLHIWFILGQKLMTKPCWIILIWLWSSIITEILIEMCFNCQNFVIYSWILFILGKKSPYDKIDIY